MIPNTSHCLLRLAGNCISIVLIAGALLLQGGCDHAAAPSASPSSSAVAASTNSADVVPAGPTELFVFFGEGQSEFIRSRLRSALAVWIQHAPAESVLHVVRTPDHKTEISVSLADAGRKRLRDPLLAEAVNTLNALLSDSGHVPDDFRGQLALEHLGPKFWSLRRTSHPARILLVGTPNAHDPNTPQWSFGRTRVPSHSALTRSDSTYPLRRLGREPIPADVPVVWLLESPGWGPGKLREDAVTQFYRHAFAVAVGGELVRMTDDVAAAFATDIPPAFAPLPEIDDPLPPRMLEFRDEPAPHDASPSAVNAVTIPDRLQTLFQEIRENPRQSLIAIHWTARFPQTDLDLWIRHPGDRAELYFENPRTSFGHLLRDVRHVGTAGDADILGRWEVAILGDVKAQDLNCWLNAYDAQTGPIQVTLVTIWQGQQSTRSFVFSVEQGDRARGYLVRDGQPAWMRLDVAL